ncbi:class I SAM-dependent methyltransferase [Streptomyces sp. SLBN-115]|uniref:class I SAM-dependent methyltransferase n=1 Tax=Streptomyces sp. SLBN-115 TaxID=2768453 RepID=UPI00115466AB|nr:class I SAM-dependent methyltransferase [Streptomyces sp. SLBN-115]TQJ56327.1 2-polyprenyl-3-methyl-5-hydroxy-6-metoxy-1,4-benzoquinol methylase [Streptomyces sp. SLBN-115]
MAESFGIDAGRYDRTRPRYPAPLIERIVADRSGVDPLRVLDVGCGTGIVARQLLAAGCLVLGVEPDGRMAEEARTHGVEAEIATFESWEPAGRTFDAVVAGQSWHWIDPVAGAAKAARTLRAGGRLAAFWNVHRLPDDLATALTSAYRRVAPDSPVDLGAAIRPGTDGYQALVAKAADAIRQTVGFGEPEQWRFDWEWTYTRDAWLDQMRTHGILTHLPLDQVTEVLAEVGAAIDATGGSFTAAYVTVAVTAVRDVDA